MENQNETNKINLKKIKYKLKNISYDEYIKNFTFGCYKTTINCTYDFLLNQYGKPNIISQNKCNKIKASWYIKIKTSNNYEYYIDIYDWEEHDKKLEDITQWNIGGKDYLKDKSDNNEYLNYDKLIKLIYYQYNNYIKKQEKLKLKQMTHQIQPTKLIKSTIRKLSSQTNLTNQINYIDENKYKQMDLDKLKEFSNDDLACVLFTRFKESGNFLMKEALIIHRALENPENYNKISNSEEKKTNYKNNILGKKDKSKYNNKKDKTKYNNKK